MDIERIQGKPEFKPDLSQQEIEDFLSLPEGKRKLAVAMDLSLIRQRQDWQEAKIIQLNNVVSDHDSSYQIWRSLQRMVLAVLGIVGGIVAILKLMEYLKWI